MNIDSNDPKVTAYALGEMNEEERADFEREMGDCKDSAALVEAIREVAGLLGDELEGEMSDIALGDDRRAAIEDKLQRVQEAPSTQKNADEQGADGQSHEGAKVVPITSRRKWIFRSSIAAGALAATLLLATTASFFLVMSGAEKSTGDSVLALHRAPSSTTSNRKKAIRSGEHRLSIKTSPDQAKVVVDGKLKPLFGRDEAEEDGDRGIRGGDGQKNAEAYATIVANRFHYVAARPLSTFSVDVDTASYANVRRFLRRKMLPPPNAVRLEEMINYFSYDYPQPKGAHPFSVSVEVASAPWNKRRRLVRIGLKGKTIAAKARPVSNLVFLLDVSGSMEAQSKLPLLRRAMSMMVRKLGEKDRVAIAVYAGSSGLVLRSTTCSDRNKPKILSAFERLSAGGSTNGGAGIQLAYNVAVSNFIEGGVNRVILATDGDFNVGTSNRQALIELIEKKAKSGVFLSVLGVGMGNYKDATLEQLADKGNGNYAYIDTLNEARKVLVRQMSGTLVTIAKDVKLQVEFNPKQVAAYRLIGYENRKLAARDFNNDKKDAGDIGVGHTVTALYEIVPAGQKLDGTPAVDALKYRRERGVGAGEMLTVKLRYKAPAGDKSTLLAVPAVDRKLMISDASVDFRFAAAVAWFGMSLRQSKGSSRSSYKVEPAYGAALSLARGALGEDRFGYRKEFVQLAKTAASIAARR